MSSGIPITAVQAKTIQCIPTIISIGPSLPTPIISS